MEIKQLDFPKQVTVLEMPKEERIDMEREIDRIKRKENPDFKGAFHEKKFVKKKFEKKSSVKSKKTKR